MIRQPKEHGIRFPKTGGDLKYNAFIKFFMVETTLRYDIGKVKGGVARTLEDRFGNMLSKVARQVWDKSDKLKVSPVNFAFIFLNRYYPFFGGKVNAIPKMPYFWDEFLIEITHEPELFSLLNYGEEHRALVCDIIKELEQGRKSKNMLNFLAEYCEGYKLHLPLHKKERSKMFETVLIMIKQIKEKGLNYFFTRHALEILKAQAWNLKKFGNPIDLKLGNLIGDTAMWRLKQYHRWQATKASRVSKQKRYNF